MKLNELEYNPSLSVYLQGCSRRKTYDNSKYNNSQAHRWHSQDRFPLQIPHNNQGVVVHLQVSKH